MYTQHIWCFNRKLAVANKMEWNNLLCETTLASLFLRCCYLQEYHELLTAFQGSSLYKKLMSCQYFYDKETDIMFNRCSSHRCSFGHRWLFGNCKNKKVKGLKKWCLCEVQFDIIYIGFCLESLPLITSTVSQNVNIIHMPHMTYPYIQKYCEAKSSRNLK